MSEYTVWCQFSVNNDLYGMLQIIQLATRVCVVSIFFHFLNNQNMFASAKTITLQYQKMVTKATTIKHIRHLIFTGISE